MRRLEFDHFEFDSVYSEEWLSLHIATKTVGKLRQFADAASFLAASNGGPVGAATLGEAQPYNDAAGFTSCRTYLKQFADIEVPDPCDWKMYVCLVDDLEWDGVFETPTMFIRYHWYSTA